jgi:FAD dependent oxidoreductase
MRVAVLGAGFQGTCLALELALRGVDVDLYDRNDHPITQAGYANEGKIHLGFVYANDSTFETANLMLRGALAFAPAVYRWTACAVTMIGVSTSFDYVVHRTSMVSMETIAGHFAKVDKCVRELMRATGSTYLDIDERQPFFRVSPEKLDNLYDSTSAAAVFETREQSIDVIRLANILRERIADERRVTFRPHTVITGVRRVESGYEVSSMADGFSVHNIYRQVVNCLWDGKLKLDQSMGLFSKGQWLHRLKYGIRILLARDDVAIPSVTVLLGSYGDIVRFSDRFFYLSWYPACLAGLSADVSPPAWPRILSGDAAQTVIDRTIAGLARIVVPLRALNGRSIQRATIAGGIILAAGKTDIDDPNSGLHRRTFVGVCSQEGYHSVNTGKYTLAPMFALEAADRVCSAR